MIFPAIQHSICSHLVPSSVFKHPALIRWMSTNQGNFLTFEIVDNFGCLHLGQRLVRTGYAAGSSCRERKERRNGRKGTESMRSKEHEDGAFGEYYEF